MADAAVPAAQRAGGASTAALTTRALDLLARERSAEAQALFVQVWRQRESELGAGHPSTIAAAIDCARVLQYQAKHGESQAVCAVQLARAERALGADHPHLVPLLCELAHISETLRQRDQQLALLQRVLAIQARAGSPHDIVRAMCAVGARQIRSGDAAAGVQMCRRALALAEQSLDVSHPDTVTVLYYLASGLQRSGVVGQRAEALPLLQRAAAAIRHRSMGSHKHRAAIARLLKTEKKFHDQQQQQQQCGGTGEGGEREGEDGGEVEGENGVRQGRLVLGAAAESNPPPTRRSHVGATARRERSIRFNAAAGAVPHSPLHTAASPISSASTSLAAATVPNNSPPAFAAATSSSPSSSDPAPRQRHPLGQGPLPPGWALMHTQSGRPFFVNKAERKTTWVDPRLTAPDDDDDPLPPGWERAVDGDGEPYYIDHTNRRTQREHPAAAQTYVLGRDRGEGLQPSRPAGARRSGHLHAASADLADTSLDLPDRDLLETPEVEMAIATATARGSRAELPPTTTSSATIPTAATNMTARARAELVRQLGVSSADEQDRLTESLPFARSTTTTPAALEGDRAEAAGSPRSLTYADSLSSLNSWESLGSTVSSLTRSLSQASLSSFNSAKALFTGGSDADRPSAAKQAALLPRLGRYLWGSSPGRRRGDGAAEVPEDDDFDVISEP